MQQVQQETTEKTALPRFFTLEMFMFTVAVLSGLVLIWSSVSPYRSIAVLIVAGIVFTLSLVIVIRLLMDPDSVRARQSDAMLRLASQTLDCMKEGMTSEAAQRICQLLLPSTAAIAVAVTDKDHILGYAGYEEADNPSGSVIRTHATHATLSDGRGRILFTPEEIGFPSGSSTIQAAIIVPLVVGRTVEGTLKFYYRRARHISETQKSIAEGFGQLLSTQMAASALEEQTKLATSMELKALQSQINPHFLYNSLSFIVTAADNPDAVTEMAVHLSQYYRYCTRKKSITTIQEEIDYARSYLEIMAMRKNIEYEIESDPELAACKIPPLILQPIIENAIEHAIEERENAKHIYVKVYQKVKDEICFEISDDGNGLTEEQIAALKERLARKNRDEKEGVGLWNVNQRLVNYYGEQSSLQFGGSIWKGLCVSFVIDGKERL